MTYFDNVKAKLLNNKIIVVLVIAFIIISNVFDFWEKAWSFATSVTSIRKQSPVNSPYAEYGGIETVNDNGKIDTVATWCVYKGRFKNIEFLFDETAGLGEKFSRVDCEFEEIPKLDCKFTTIQENKHIYLSDRIYVTDETKDIQRVSIVFAGDKNNQPRCSLVFEGVIKDGKLNGDLIWKRIDQSKHPNLSFVVKKAITKTLSI